MTKGARCATTQSDAQPSTASTRKSPARPVRPGFRSPRRSAPFAAAVEAGVRGPTPNNVRAVRRGENRVLKRQSHATPSGLIESKSNFHS
jgi:hypothetical protein